MIVGRWYVQLAAIWHWYFSLRIYIYLIFLNIYRLSIPFFSFFFSSSLTGINKLNGIVDDTSMF